MTQVINVGSPQSITVPVLYLQASNDRVVPRSAGATIVAGSPNVSLIEQVGPHFLLQAALVACARCYTLFDRIE